MTGSVIRKTPKELHEQRARLIASTGLSEEVLRERGEAFQLYPEHQAVWETVQGIDYLLDGAEAPPVYVSGLTRAVEHLDGMASWGPTIISPATRTALATWLRETSVLHEPQRCTDGPPDCTCTTGCGWCGDEDWPCSDMRSALAVAHHILEGGPR
ncbi:hypothetical protein ACFWW5_11005 [Streptomyces albidoflavus]